MPVIIPLGMQLVMGISGEYYFFSKPPEMYISNCHLQELVYFLTPISCLNFIRLKFSLEIN